MPEIEIEIDEEGTITADFKGFRGLDCKRAEKELLDKLENMQIKKTGEQLKPEALHEKQKRKR